MACCCRRGQGGEAPPEAVGLTVAIAGASGFLGKAITPAFVMALNEGRIQELRVLTHTPDAVDEFTKQGAKAYAVDFSSKEDVVDACTGVDVVICTIGTDPGTDESKAVLLSALVEAGVKTYFPSEFGCNHYTRTKKYTHPVFEAKKKHFKEAQGKSIKVVGMMCSFVMEGIFQSWFGMDNQTEVWSLIGGADLPVAVTAERDVGRFTVEAALKACKDPNSVPEWLEVYSDIRTMKNYAKAFDKVAKTETKLEFIPVPEAVAQYNSTQDFLYILRILIGDGDNDFKNANGNGLLNPNETVWKLKKIEEFAQETAGRPGKA